MRPQVQDAPIDFDSVLASASASSFPTPSISAPDDWAFARDNREDRARLLALCVSCAVAGALAGGAFLMFLR